MFSVFIILYAPPECTKFVMPFVTHSNSNPKSYKIQHVLDCRIYIEPIYKNLQLYLFIIEKFLLLPYPNTHTHTHMNYELKVSEAG